MSKAPGTNRNGLIAALDVGTSKVCCFIADPSATPPRVVGIGQQASHGIRNGAIVDMEAAETAVRNAVHAAEQMAGTQIERVMVGLTAGKPHSRQISIELTLDMQEVHDRDLKRALALGSEPARLNGHLGDDSELIHSIALGYSVDGNRGIRDPRGMLGERLGIDLHLVTATSGPVRNLINCIQRAHLDVDRFVVAPYAAGLASLVEDERELGVTLIDMGGGTTSIAVYFEGQPVHVDVIPVGGLHVTNDIARGLSTPVSHAERIKTLYGHAIAAAADDRELIDVPQVGEYEDGANQQIPRSLLTGIIQPRLEETFELVRSRLEAAGMDRIGGRRVVLTGGASQLPGLTDLAGLVLDRQVRVARHIALKGLPDSTSGPAHAVVSGLIIYATQFKEAGPSLPTAIMGDEQPTPGPSGVMGRLGHWFREHF